jgi:hypothetical protein
MLHEEIKILGSQQEGIKELREETFSPCKKDGLICAQCSGVVSAQVTCDFKQKQSNLNGTSDDIEKLRCDLIELIEIRRSARRQHMKEVISSDTNLLANKIECLKYDVSNSESIETQWSEIVAGRRKIRSHIWHIESKPILVMHNGYEVLNHYIGEYVNSVAESVSKSCLWKRSKTSYPTTDFLFATDRKSVV